VRRRVWIGDWGTVLFLDVCAGNSGGGRVCRTKAAQTSALSQVPGAMTQLATVARDCSFRCIYYDYTMCGVLRWPKQTGEERLEASLRRRCRYQRCRTLRVTGRVGRVDGGRIEVPFAIQSDGLGVDSAMRSCSHGAGSAVAAGVAGVGGDSDDLKLSSRQGGDRATVSRVS
jgi:hypothetical protein